MKHAMNKTKMIVMSLVALCTIALSGNAFANVKAEDPAQLTFIGKVQNKPVFQLNLNNAEEGEYFITIKDLDRNVIFTEKIQGKNLFRRYHLAVDDEDLNSNFGLSIEVMNAKTRKTDVYKVSTKTHVTENIVVAKS